MEERKAKLRGIDAELEALEGQKRDMIFRARKEATYSMTGVSPTGFDSKQTSEDYREADRKQTKIKEDSIKGDSKPKGKTIDLNALKDQGKYEQDKDMLGMTELGKHELKWTALTQGYEAITKYQEALRNFKNTFAKGVMDDYFLSTGQLDKVGIEARVDEKVKKPNTSSKALDELKAQGATQIEAPEVPPEDKGALVDMIISGIADIAKNIGGMVSGDAATSVAIASSQTAGEISGERVQAMIARDLANYDQRKEKIRLLNAELMAKHKSDIVAYTSEFEQRASAEERAYQNLRMQSLDMEYNRAMQIMGIYQSIEEQELQAGITKQAAENQLEQFNQKGEMDVAQHNQAMEMQRQRFNFELLNAKMMAEKLKKEKFMYIEQLVNGLGNQMANISGVSNNSTALRWALSDIDSWKGDPTSEDETNIIDNGSVLGSNYFNSVRALVAKGDLTPQEGANAIKVANTMAMSKYLPKTNMNDEEIKAVGKANVNISPDADTQIGKSLPMFSYVGNRSNVYFVTSLNILTKTMYEQAAENYQKMPSSERGANPMPAGFPWGVTE